MVEIYFILINVHLFKQNVYNCQTPLDVTSVEFGVSRRHTVQKITITTLMVFIWQSLSISPGIIKLTPVLQKAKTNLETYTINSFWIWHYYVMYWLCFIVPEYYYKMYIVCRILCNPQNMYNYCVWNLYIWTQGYIFYNNRPISVFLV